MKIALVACVKSKLPLKRGEVVQAQDLYTSDLFKKSRAWAECLMARGELDGWVILSAKFGLVFPWGTIPTYDETLSGASVGVRRKWSKWVAPQLLEAFGPNVTYYLMAGKDYSQELIKLLPNPVEDPMAGARGIGDKLGWLKQALEGCGDETDEDLLAEDRIRRMVDERILKLERKGRQRTKEDERLLADLKSVTAREIRDRARVRCFYCGADPRAMEFLDVVGRELINTGCCPAGAEELARWLGEASTADRLAWAQSVYGPYLEGYGQIASVVGPYGEVEAKRRGGWQPTGEVADPYSISYQLDARVVRDRKSFKKVASFVKKHHAHMPWAAGKAWKFGIMVYNGPDLVAVAHVQNPGSRMYPQDGTWLDVARVAIRRDIPPHLRANAASLIYATAWRAAKDGTWVSDDEWARLKSESDKKRAKAEKASGKPSWRVQRRAERLITYTLADEELGTTLKASGWEPASWSPPHKKPTGARAGRGQKAGDKPKIRWQIGLRPDRRRILGVVDRIETKTKQADVVEVARSRRGPGGLAQTLLPSVYGLSNEQLAAQHYYTWEETEQERRDRPKGSRRMKNPADPRRRRLERGPAGEVNEARVAYEQLRLGRTLTPRQLELVLREWVASHRFIDVNFWDQERWRARGEQYGNDAPLTMTAEGALNHILNEGGPEYPEWEDLVTQAGYMVMPSYAWAFHFYPVNENPPKEQRIWQAVDSFLDYLGTVAGQVYPRKNLAIFFVEDFVEYSGRMRPGKHATILRRFERLKADVRHSGVLLKLSDLERVDPVLADWAESKAWALIRERGRESSGHVSEVAYFLILDVAKSRYEEVMQQPGAVPALQVAAPLVPAGREATIKEVMAHFGVPYNTVIEWANVQGAPHDRRARRKTRGGMTKTKYYYFSLRELEDWRRLRRAEGKVFEKDRVPAAEGSAVLNQAWKQLNVTLEELAQLLDIPYTRLVGYIYPEHKGVGTIPRSVVSRAQWALENEPRRVSKRELVATEEQVRDALRRSRGVWSGAARILGVASPTTVKNLARLYGIPFQETDPLITQLSRDDVRQAMIKSGYLVKPAAKILGISGPSLARLIGSEHGYGLEEEFVGKLRKRGSRPAPEVMAAVLEEAGGDRHRAAAALGLHHDVVARVAREYGLGHMIVHATRHQVTRDQVEAAIEEGVRRGLSPTAMGPELLGMSPTTFKRHVDKHGLGHLLEPYRRGPRTRFNPPLDFAFG